MVDTPESDRNNAPSLAAHLGVYRVHGQLLDKAALNAETESLLPEEKARLKLYQKKKINEKGNFQAGEMPTQSPTSHREAYFQFLASHSLPLTHPKRDEMTIEEILGSVGYNLYLTALEEERNSREYVQAVLLEATETYYMDRDKLPDKAMNVVIAGPSSSGKTYATEQVIMAKLGITSKTGDLTAYKPDGDGWVACESLHDNQAVIKISKRDFEAWQRIIKGPTENQSMELLARIQLINPERYQQNYSPQLLRDLNLINQVIKAHGGQLTLKAFDEIALKTDSHTLKKHQFVSIDGGVERKVSRVRNVTKNHLIKSQVRCPKLVDSMGVKEQINAAILNNMALSTVEPLTYTHVKYHKQMASKPGGLFKKETARTPVFCIIKAGVDKNAFQNVVNAQGEQRAYPAKDYFYSGPIDDINLEIDYEYKKYNKDAFNYGVQMSNMAATEFDMLHGEQNHFVMLNDRVAITIQGNDYRLVNANDDPSTAKFISYRDLLRFERVKQDLVGKSPQEMVDRLFKEYQDNFPDSQKYNYAQFNFMAKNALRNQNGEMNINTWLQISKNVASPALLLHCKQPRPQNNFVPVVFDEGAKKMRVCKEDEFHHGYVSEAFFKSMINQSFEDKNAMLAAIQNDKTPIMIRPEDALAQGMQKRASDPLPMGNNTAPPLRRSTSSRVLHRVQKEPAATQAPPSTQKAPPAASTPTDSPPQKAGMIRRSSTRMFNIVRKPKDTDAPVAKPLDSKQGISKGPKR